MSNIEPFVGFVHFVDKFELWTLVGSIHFVDKFEFLTLVGSIHFVDMFEFWTLIGSVHFVDWSNSDPSWGPSILWTWILTLVRFVHVVDSVVGMQ